MKHKTQILRLNISSYQGPLFFEKERDFLSNIDNLEYTRIWDGHSPVILISNTHTKLEELSVELLKNTKLIIHPNSGYDNFTADFTKKNNFPIILGNPIRANAVSEYILSSLHNHFSRIVDQEVWDKARLWNRKRLKDLKIQIIGFGMIGKILSDSLAPLVSEIYIYDPFKNMDQLKPEQSDVILMASSLNPTSKNLLDEHFFNRLPDGVLIINAARGGLIKQESLLDFLKKKTNSYAILDVFSKEPFNSDEFRDIPNLTKTSHIAGVYERLNEELLCFERQVLQDFFNKDESQAKFEEKYQDLILENRLSQDFLI